MIAPFNFRKRELFNPHPAEIATVEVDAVVVVVDLVVEVVVETVVAVGVFVAVPIELSVTLTNLSCVVLVTCFFFGEDLFLVQM